ncbi:PASTA domain-containing protein [Pseudoclavibacter helvolus]|uniref:PASTA domain-containing protein n=1 Tax=Pseudoclavibacter helvolus TaxID=255205 RepID=A0A7W4UM13_9MICO|nr:PASTA domain-containing protein [Pseudoclavibacter helvolus]MBB2956949.1 hypothetical protein [Pseudoclavibacter helvolus]
MQTTLKLTLAATAALSLAMLTGCSGGTTSAAPEPATETSAPVELSAVPDVTGLDGATAKDTLEEAGFLVAIDGGDEDVLMPSNWTVDAYSPTEAEPRAKITLTVSKTPTPPAEATATGLTATYAQSACTQAIDAEFPFGADQHWILGKLAEELQADTDRWFFKVTVDVTNASGATQHDVNVECYVSGTNDAPSVEPLVYY